MIVRWPGKVPGGTVSDAVWYFAGVLPTMAELAGVRPPSNVDGISVLPTLLGGGQILDDRFLYWEIPSGGFKQAVQKGNWKAVRYGLYGELELYDLKADVSETTNVAAQNPNIVAEIEQYLATGRTD